MISFRIDRNTTGHLSDELRRLEIVSGNGHRQFAQLSFPETRILTLLLSDVGRIRTRLELTEHGWAGRPVSPSSLSQSILNLRRALGQDDATTVIKTVPHQGYQLLVELIASPAGEASKSKELVPRPTQRASRWRMAKPLRIALETCLVSVNALVVLLLSMHLSPALDSVVGDINFFRYRKEADVQYDAAETLRASPQVIESSIKALKNAPPLLSGNISASNVYVNRPLLPGSYSYFICDGKITASSANCFSYKLKP